MSDLHRSRTLSGSGRRAAPRAVVHDAPEPAPDAGQTASERAYQELRTRILDGRFPSGHRLKEVALAKELGISRTPVRDALHRLNSEGLLDFRANLGATVAVWSEDQIALMFRIRAMLEPFAAEIAAAHIADAEIEELRTLCTRMEEASRGRGSRDLAVLSEANARFHRIILDAARSEHLAKLVSIAVDAPLARRIFGRYSPEETDRSMRHHREIVDALAHRDPAWSASAMRTHILSAIGRGAAGGRKSG